MERLSKIYPVEELRQKRGAIKTGIAAYFFQTLQEVVVSIVEGGVIRVTKTFLFQNRDEAFDRIVHKAILDLLRLKSEQETYRHADFMWIFPEKERTALLEHFGQSSETEVKHGLRLCIEKAFELEQRDIVLFLRNRLFIRMYVPPEPLLKGSNRRFSGQDPEAMAALYESTFPDGAWETIELYLPEIMETSLNFTTIDNRTFNRTYVPVFRSVVEIVALEALGDGPKERLEGLVGYVLRHYFDAFLRYSAHELLRHVEQRDRNAEVFIKYYRDEVMIDADGQKLQKYAIVDAKQQHWNYSAILSVLMQYKQATKRFDQQAAKCREAAKRVDTIKGILRNDRRERKQREDDIREIEADVRLRQLRNGTADNDSLERLKLAKERHQNALLRYRNRQTELENWEKLSARQEKHLEEIRQQNVRIEEAIELIINALALTFARR